MKSSLLILLLLLSHLTPITRADPLYQICQNLGNYTTNSTYQSNLNLLLHTLSSNGPITGFLTDTEGSSPNQVFGRALCRGDTIQSNCASCLSNAVQDVVQLCPHQMSAIIWYDDCQLRYSNATFFSKWEGDL
ncbi:Cysteine-rich repeat secretory protein 1 [Acorus gramineus]|uniref:Cysteine-rich repeat secretory protein 1 n=1 Tax=Acorus gramineus TaxID=55184 RepID=A0AAV9A8R0_ACOGR|nr:Cysteine-rich repeat secretory protein 1 [Acorus gramineus]